MKKVVTVTLGSSKQDFEFKTEFLGQSFSVKRMGADDDPLSAVDPDLKVRGVAGLRVADAAIMPTDCRANLHFTCVMIGEMAARRMRG